MLNKNAVYLLQQRYCKSGESPEGVFKRVANFLAEGDFKFEDSLQTLMTNGVFLPNSPCLFNAGFPKGMLHACMTKDTIINTLSGDFTVEELLNKENFYVFSCDGKKVKLGKANRIIKTRENEDVYKITFDNGSFLKLTKDHKILMRDGTYKEVQYLTKNDSVIPFNYEYSKLYKKERYRQIYENIDTGKKPAYIFSFKEHNKKGVSKGNIIHHKDFNRKNDSPDNLVEISKEEHFKLHGENSIMKTNEMKNHFSELMKDNKIAIGVKRTKEHKQKLKDFIKGNTERSEKINKALKGKPKTAEHTKAVSNAIKNPHSNPDYRKKYLIGLEKREQNRKNKNLYNHKVVSIEYYGKEDVYDIESVEKYHNFAANGIFIHNCFILPIEDDIHSIFSTVSNMAYIFKGGGGVGINFSKLREKNSHLSGGGTSSGVLSFMEIFDNVVDTVKQGGMRRGALMGILDYNHPEIFNFIKVKLEGKLQNFNLSIMVTDDFMKAVLENNNVEITSPKNGLLGSVGAKDIFDVACFASWVNGDPAFLFKDRINQNNPFFPQIVLDTVNPCSEVALPYYGACCLGSINVSKFVWKNEFNFDRFAETCRVGMRALSSMNRLSEYPLPEIKKCMEEYNPVGLGIMGFADCLIKLGIRYDSQDCLDFIDKLGSVYKEATDSYAGDNFYFYKRIIAPTGSLSILADCSSGIEPVYDVAFERSLTIGKIEEVRDLYKSEFVRTAHQVNPKWHIKVLAKWQEYLDGGVSKTINMPHDASVEDIKNAYLTAWKMGVKGITVYRDGSRDQVLTGISPTNKFEKKVSAGKCSDDTCTL